MEKIVFYKIYDILMVSCK